MVKGVDVSGIEKIAKYKQEHMEDRDVLEIYDKKFRESEESFRPAPPSTHVSSHNDINEEGYRSFYDGSGKYSKKTHDLVDLYLSIKPHYDSRRLEFVHQEPIENRRYANYPDSVNQYSTQNFGGGGLSQVLSTARGLVNAQIPTKGMNHSLSMNEINSRIRHTIDTGRRSYMM